MNTSGSRWAWTAWGDEVDVVFDADLAQVVDVYGLS